jgi:hypothetical protein
MDAIIKEIKKIEKSANKLKSLAGDNNAIRKNAEIILTYSYILKYAAPAEELK